MKRRTNLLLLLAAPSLFAADALPSAESILDRYAQVTGSKQAYENRKTEFTRGTMEASAMGLKGIVTRYMDAKGNYYSSLEIAGIGMVQTGVHDGVAWEVSDITGPRIMEGAERAQALREATLNATYRWRELYPKVETTGMDTINGEECYKVVLTPAEGNPETLYVAKQSGLGVKVTTVSATQMGNLPIEVLLSNYRAFDGLTVPTKTIQKAAGQELVLTIETVQGNAPIPAGRFDLPADIQALVAKRPK